MPLSVRLSVVAALVVFAALPMSIALGHGADADHDHDHADARADDGDTASHVLVVAQADVKAQVDAGAAPAAAATSGQGAMVFSYDAALTDALPADARPFEPGMHGGFTEDPDTGVVYTGIPGYGLCTISPDLRAWARLGDDPRLKDNIHGLVFFTHDGRDLIALAQNDARRVLVVTPAGQVVQELTKPAGGEFGFEPADAYYRQKDARFIPTDVTYLDGRLYVVTGYSPGDFVLTARLADGAWAWGTIAWGGRGGQPGQFKTAHGVYAHEGHVYVASREAHQVLKFTPTGELVESIADIPAGSRICNVAHLHEHFFFCPLAKVGKQSSAPIYAHTGQKLASTIIPGDLGVPVLNHIHHVWPHYVTEADGTKRLYLLVHGWNKGKYAVLRHEDTARAAKAGTVGQLGRVVIPQP